MWCCAGMQEESSGPPVSQYTTPPPQNFPGIYLNKKKLKYLYSYMTDNEHLYDFVFALLRLLEFMTKSLKEIDPTIFSI
jgi:hypothetical protein